MKKLVLGVAVMATLTGSLVSCNKIKDATKAMSDAAQGGMDIDYTMLTNQEELKTWYNKVIEKAGENAKVMDEVSFSINRSSKEGMIRHEGKKDECNLRIIYQDPANKHRVAETSFLSYTGNWLPVEKKEIQVIGGNVEDFRLEDELFDFTQITPEILHKVATDALAKYKNEEKYEYQYVKMIVITVEGINVDVFGKLKANGQEKTEYYKANLKGNKK